MPEWAPRDLTPFSGSFRAESGPAGVAAGCLRTPVAVLWSAHHLYSWWRQPTKSGLCLRLPLGTAQ